MYNNIKPEYTDHVHVHTTRFLQGKPNQFYCKEIECFVYYKVQEYTLQYKLIYYIYV